MKNYRLNFYIIGIDDLQTGQLDNLLIDVKHKGDIWNKRTGKQYEENIAKKTIYTTYQEGFQPIVDELIAFIEENPIVSNLLDSAKEISLQICVDLDDDCRVPYIRFSPKQLAFFSNINSDIDFHIS